jgi:murein DD-endopeptidase MepM/ murein hydrolase activator NlpD
LFDTGTRDAEASSGEESILVNKTASAATHEPLSSKLAHWRLSAQRALKLYGSASQLALGQSLGQHRWLAATGIAAALSFGLLITGLVALVAPYSGVQTAALTAEDTPQIIALNRTKPSSSHVATASVTPAAPAPSVAATSPSVVVASTEATLRGSAAGDEAASTTSTHMTSTAPAEASPAAADLPENADIVTASIAPAVPALPKTVNTLVSLDPGATLMQVLTDQGADRVDAYHAIAALRPVFSPTKLRSGQEIALTFLTTPATDDDPDAGPSKLLTSISLTPDVDSKIEVQRGNDGSYTTEQIKRQLTSGFARAEGVINSSLFLDAAQAGVPAPIIVEMIHMFSYSVDFQREIHAGDSFEVFFDRKYDKNGAAVKEGDISYASLTILGKTHKLWRYKTSDGTWDYFDENGRSMKKFLMKTPVDGARISSAFGRRKHPILGYTKFHEGVDFAAPRGTPIYAAGNGKIEIAGVVRGYGNYIRIKHANGYETGYGHMNGFARGIRRGVTVHQGEVIGYVGSTGRSTGPHLHYEISVHGKKVNPLGIKVPTGTQLAGRDLKNYKTARANIMNEMAEAPELTKVAQANTGESASKAN